MQGLRHLLASALFGWLVLAGSGFAAEQEKRAGNAIVRARLDRDAITLSDTIVLTVSVEGRSPLEIDAIKDITPSPAWVVTPLPGPESTPLSDRRMRWQQGYRISPLQNGEVALPLEPLRIRSGGSEPMTVKWDEFKVKVTTVVSAPAMAALKNNTDIERLPDPPQWPWGMTLGIGAVTGGLLLVSWGAWRASKKPAPKPVELPAAGWALQELARIESLNLPAAGQVERFHTLLADVVRQYVDRRFGVRTIERTTAELLAALVQTKAVLPEQQELLRSFFERCDLAKFARAGYGPEECQEAARLARAFIEQTKPQASGGA